MIGYQQALNIIKTTAVPLSVVTVPLREAAGTVIAMELPCPSAVPPFDNSAMDGFAVRAADTSQATEDTPVRLTVRGMITAGDTAASDAATRATAWEIMTGAPMPAGYDGVIPVEQVEVERDPSGKPLTVELRQPVSAGRNLRRAGEDFARGDALLDSGRLIHAGQIMGLAATGVSELAVRKPPRVAAITTGNELTDAEAELEPGKIHDSNGPYLDAAIASLGAANAGVYRTGDSAEQLIRRIESLQADTDVILTTGGVSAGRMDFVPMALEQLGADILFHRVAIRPGKPILFARLPDGTLVFGLPGNPIAVAVGLRFFVVPALRHMTGQPEEQYATAVLTSDHRKKAGMTFCAKAHAHTDTEGRLRVDILPGQESFKISPLMRANCWLVADHDAVELPADSLQRIAALRPDLLG